MGNGDSKRYGWWGRSDDNDVVGRGNFDQRRNQQRNRW